jgi:hypothetical protein
MNALHPLVVQRITRRLAPSTITMLPCLVNLWYLVLCKFVGQVHLVHSVRFLKGLMVTSKRHMAKLASDRRVLSNIVILLRYIVKLRSRRFDDLAALGTFADKILFVVDDGPLSFFR